MKTSVTKFMMSFALMGCLIFGASDAMAQGRSRSQGGSTSSRSQSAAVSRSSNTSTPSMSRDNSSTTRSSATPQVNRSSSTTSTTRSSATPQVNRSTSTSSTTRSSATPQVNRSTSTTSTTRSTAMPQVNRSTSTTSTTRSTATPQVNRNTSTSTSSDRTSQSTAVRPEKTTTPATSSTGTRPGNGAVTRGGSNSTTTHSNNVAPRDNSERTMAKPEATTSQGNRTDGVKPGNGGKPGGGKPDNGGKPGGGKPDNGGKPGGGKPDNGGKPGAGHSGGKHGGRGYGPDHRYDYSGHPHSDAFSWNYTHHSWSRPLPPPVRPYRPAPWVWYRPTIPVGWHPYAGAPVIDRILGLVFGSLYDASLDHLYYSGYYIDGYADGIIYLRDVPMLNLYWPDVMLNYEYNRLVNAQFIYYNKYYDLSRYDMVYNSLRRIYGSPVYRDGMVVSWYGGDSRGYVTLSMVDSPDGYYTTMSIGY